MATKYINSITGNDSNDGTSGLPWKTISKANATLAAGDKGLFSGIWDETIVPTNNGSSGNLIEYEADPSGGGAIIDRGSVVSTLCADISSKNYVRLNGFLHRNAAECVDATSAANCEIINGEITNIENANGNVLTMASSTDCLVSGVNIHDIPDSISAVRCKSSTGLTIRSVQIQDMGGDGINGDLVTNLLVEDCILRGFTETSGGHQDGIAMETVNGMILRRNRISDFTQGIYGADQGGGATWDNVEIYCNVMFSYNYGNLDDEGAPGILVDGITGGGLVVAGLWIYCNTFGYCGPKALELQLPTSTGIVVRNNAYHQVRGTNAFDNIEIIVNSVDVETTTSDYGAYSGPATASGETNKVTGDPISPLFVDYTWNEVDADPSDFDFHLAASSSLINAGDPGLTSAVTVPSTFLDIDGVARDKDSGDIGAYEFVADAGGDADTSGQAPGAGSSGCGVGVRM